MKGRLDRSRSLPNLFSGCSARSITNECDGVFYYRPIHHVWNFAWYQISSQPWIFHLANLILFFLVVVATFAFVRVLTKNNILALLTALLFLIHPRNSEVVNWSSAVAELLLVLFLFNQCVIGCFLSLFSPFFQS